MYEKIYDKDYLHRNEASLVKEGITGDLFKSNVTGAIKKVLKGTPKEMYTKHGPFKYRLIEYKDAGLDGKDSLLTITPFKKLGNFYYFGQTENDLPQGRGIAIYKDGSIYEGFWHEGKRHLSGRMLFAHTHTDIGE